MPAALSSASNSSRAHGPAGVRRIAALGLPIFLDLKLHDIPNTVAKAVEALAPLAAGDPDGSCGRRPRHAVAAKARRAASHESRRGHPADQPRRRRSRRSRHRSLAAEQVARLAWIARDAGIDGIVCSGAEVAEAQAAWPDGFFVVPGMRPAGADVADQKRVVTPRQALDDGASVLVIGRPITGAADPRRAIMDIAAGFPRCRPNRGLIA